MEEGKAAFLYDSLSRQGLGAARFKQGLGFEGGLAANAGSIAFKKAGADFSTEILEADRTDNHTDDRTDNRTDAFEREWNAQESKRVVQSIADKLRGKRNEDEYVRRRSRRASSSDEERDVSRRRLNSDESGRRESDEKKASEKKREDRSPSYGESSEEDRARERRIAARRRKGSERTSGDEEKRRKEGGRSGREIDTKRRSRSRSRDRERGGVKDRENGRGREGSRDEREGRDHRHRSSGSHRREKHLESSRDRGDRRHAARSSRRDRSHSRDRNEARNGSRKEKAEQEPIDYAEIIRGYENMSAAEKLKARTKYALSQTVRKDSANGASTEWERFAFNATAPLDEDAQQDMYGDDTKAADDASHLQNTGSTFGIAKAQAVREAEKQAAHEAAIFGRPVEQTEGSLNGKRAEEGAQLLQTGDSEEDEEDRPVVVATEEEPQANGQASEQIEKDTVKPAVPSWKERALKAQQARKEAAKLAGSAG